jgi:hypothetical protein
MRAKVIETNKPEHYIHAVRNADTSTQALIIPTGTPLILNLSATPQPSGGSPPGWEDGLQVVLPSTAGASNSSLYYYGIASGPIPYPTLGESLVHGVGYALVVKATRSATSASWGSASSVAGAGLALTIDTTNNAFGSGASSASYPFILLDNFASYAGSASNTSDTRLAITQLMRCFVRVM